MPVGKLHLQIQTVTVCGTACSPFLHVHGKSPLEHTGCISTSVQWATPGVGLSAFGVAAGHLTSTSSRLRVDSMHRPSSVCDVATVSSRFELRVWGSEFKDVPPVQPV